MVKSTAWNDLVVDRKSFYSPKEIFYPIRESLFYFSKDQITVPDIDIKPILLFLRPCDINGIKRLDEIFLQNGDFSDFYYQRRRELLKFAMIECTDGFDSCYCVSMNANRTEDYALAASFGDQEIMMKVNDESLLTDCLNNAKILDFEPSFCTRKSK